MCSALQVVLLLILGQNINALKYQFVPENEDLFTDCPKQPSDVFNIEGLFDLTDLTLTLNKDTITVSGNSTSKWNVQPNDRIQVRYELLRYDRGSWLSTVFAIKVDDFCKDMFDKNQYWYMQWTKHITNANEFRSKCPINHPGSTLIHESFDVDLTYDVMSIVPLNGRYKIQMICEAYDQKNVARSPRVCFDMIGEIIRKN